MRLPEQSEPVIRIPIPLDRRVGLGEVVKAVTEKVGIEACQGCRRRAATLDRWVAFGPRES
ncbi:MAG: hypothetical protein MI919_28490 [Holophagales bacterium]|nr:hypothetical protein [Holophagales bacterium]